MTRGCGAQLDTSSRDSTRSEVQVKIINREECVPTIKNRAIFTSSLISSLTSHLVLNSTSVKYTGAMGCRAMLHMLVCV